VDHRKREAATYQQVYDPVFDSAAVGLGGREGDLFRRVVGWSLLLLLIMCVLVYLQSTSLLSWMVV
jgi:L-lactate permease